MPDAQATQLLRQLAAGDASALDQLTPIVYEELHRLAKSAFRNERANHTLQPTALVNEAYLQLAGADVEWQSSGHFFALAARMMRRILVDHAEAKNTAKRGGGLAQVTLADVGSEQPLDVVLDVDRALKELSKQDETGAAALEMHQFGGLTQPQIALALGVSEVTVSRKLRFCRAWLHERLSGPAT